MKYRIFDEIFADANAAAYFVTQQFDEDIFDDMLDECNPDVVICGYSYSPSVALYRVDKVAYREAMLDYYDSLAQDIEYDLERMREGTEEEFYGVMVECLDDEEEEEA